MIGDLAKQVGFRGSPQHKIAEPGAVQNLPVIDNSDPTTKNNIHTSIDTYVSGQYVARNGRMFEVTQRYTIYVSYSRSTQGATLKQVRDRITGDFAAKYGRTFNVSAVFIPALPMPKVDDGVGEEQLYGGSGLFKAMTRIERARFEMDTERLKARTNIGSIKGRYGLRRK